MGFFKKSLRCIAKTSKQATKSCDVAPHTVTFTYNDSADYKSVIGGVCAILCGLFIAAVFVLNFIEVMSKEKINAIEVRKVSPDSANATLPLRRGMMFAIGVEQLDFRYEKIFNIKFSRTLRAQKPRNQSEIRRSEQVQLVPCTLKVWKDLGLEQFYESYSLKQMLCADPLQVMKLSDDRGYRIQIEECNPEGPQPANPSAYIDQMNNYFNGFKNNPQWTQYYNQNFDLVKNLDQDEDEEKDEEDFEQYQYEEDDADGNETWVIEEEDYGDVSSPVQNSFQSVGNTSVPPSYDTVSCLFEYYQKVFKLPRQYRIQFYYVNSLINANQHDYFKRYVDYQEFLIELTNDSMLRTQAELYLASYEVQTNNNLLFDYDWRVERRRGLIKLDPIQTSVFIYSNQTNISTANTTSRNWEKMNNFFTLDIKRTNTLLHVKRSYKTVLSIIVDLGGYISFFGVVLGILIVSYNELSFELQIVKNLYFQQKNQSIQTSDLNYFDFIIYQIYCALQFFGCNPEWKFCQELKSKSDHAKKVLDLQNVVKKIQHLQKVGMAVLNEEKYYGLYLQQPQNLCEQQARLEAAGVYTKLRTKYFNDGQIQEQEINKLKLETSDANLKLSLMNDRIQKIPQKNSQTINIMIEEKKINNTKNAKYLDESDIQNEDDEEDEENKIEGETLEKLKGYLLKIKNEAKNDQIAERIYNKIDPNVKYILLDELNPNTSRMTRRVLVTVEEMQKEKPKENQKKK